MAQRSGTAFHNISTRDADGGKTGEGDGNDPGPAVLNADDLMPLGKRYPEANARGLRIQPRGQLGRQFTERTRFARADGIPGGDDGVIELPRVTHAKGLKGFSISGQALS